MSDDLIAFLKDRLDEDEQMWGDMLGSGAELTLVGHYFREGVPGLLKRQLAEVEAKRLMLTEHGPEEVASLDRETWGQLFIVCRRCKLGERQVAMPCTTLRLLAVPFAGHPDYRPEWRPAAD